MMDTLTQLARLREIRRRRAERALSDAQRVHTDAVRAHDISGSLLTIRRASKTAAERETYGRLVKQGADGQALTALLTNLDAQSDALAEAERKHVERRQRVERTEKKRAQQAQALAQEQSKDAAWDELTRHMQNAEERRMETRQDDEQDGLSLSRRALQGRGPGK